MLDAYAVRKAIPRVVLAVIGINLSIYLCIAAIDITMVVGRGLNQLLVAPFIDQNSFGAVGIEANAENTILGVLAGTGVLAALFLAVIASVGAAGAAILSLLGFMLPLIITISLIALAVLFTLVIRTGLLVFLTVISPVAMACYVLPGTEKYFRQWGDLFLRTLLVYPIIAAIFAMSNVLAAILLNSAGRGTASMIPQNYIFAQSDAIGTVQIVAAILVLYAPLVLIPFAFKLAGGAISAVMNAASGRAANLAGRAGKRIAASREDPYSFWGARKAAVSRNRLQRRADFAESLKQRGSASGRSGFSRRMYRAGAGIIGGQNIEARASNKRAEVSKLLNEQINSGRDEEIRGLTVDIGQGYEALQRQDLARTENGVRQYKSLAGAWVKEADVIAGHNRWGRDTFAQQAALSYEMRKAANDEQVADVSQRYASLATNSWGMSENSARGAFIGAGFENQNQHLEFKHTNAMTGELNYDKFVEEAYEKKGSYPLSQMSGHTARQLMLAYNDPNATPERREQIRSISETFMQRGMGGRQIVGTAGEGGEGQPIEIPGQMAMDVPGQEAAGQTREGRPVGYFGGQGAAHTNEAFRELARLTGVLNDGGPSNPYGDPGTTTGNHPGPDRRSTPGAPHH